MPIGYSDSLVTTIQLHEETLVLLKKLRELTGARSYDEALVTVVKKELKPASAYGVLKGKITRRELDAFIREEHVE